MTRIKLDENLGRRGRRILEHEGHEVATVLEERLVAASDRELISTCAREGRALVSLDLDFANPLRFPPHDYHGVAVVLLSSRPTAEELHEALRFLSGALKRRSIDGRLWIVQRQAIREYQEDLDTE